MPISGGGCSALWATKNGGTLPTDGSPAVLVPLSGGEKREHGGFTKAADLPEVLCEPPEGRKLRKWGARRKPVPGGGPFFTRLLVSAGSRLMISFQERQALGICPGRKKKCFPPGDLGPRQVVPRAQPSIEFFMPLGHPEKGPGGCWWPRGKAKHIRARNGGWMICGVHHRASPPPPPTMRDWGLGRGTR